MKRSYTKEQEIWLVNKLPYYSPIVLVNMFKEHFNEDINVRTIRNIKHANNIKSNYQRKIYNTTYREKIKKPLYNETIGNRGRKYVRVANGKYQIKTRYIWEQYHNRKIPKDYYVIFLDHDKNNYDIKNLKLVKKGALSYSRRKEIELYDKDIIKTIDLLMKLDKKIRKRKENEKKRLWV